LQSRQGEGEGLLFVNKKKQKTSFVHPSPPARVPPVILSGANNPRCLNNRQSPRLSANKKIFFAFFLFTKRKIFLPLGFSALQPPPHPAHEVE